MNFLFTSSVFPYRADGQSSAKNLHLHEHQGATWLLLCCVWTGWRSGVQRTSHPRPPGSHAGDCPVPGEARTVQPCVSEFFLVWPYTLNDKRMLLFFFCEQLRSLGNKLKEGDVILSNHPSAGGSHLPDLTVITPVSPPRFSTLFLPSNSSSILSSLPFFFLVQVFRKGVSGPVFFVASRGHHADIGGITPGSMPPHSTSLQQEGAVFTSFKLVTGGVFQEEGKWGGDELGPECDTLLKGESIENQEMTLNLR